MKAELLSLLSFAIGIAAYTASQMCLFGKLRWSKPGTGFWEYSMDKRKYHPKFEFAPDNWYYRYIARVRYKERWFTSTNLTVFLTDGYHFMQFLFLLFISLSVVPILGWTYGIAFWILAHVIHFTLYRTLQREY